MTAFYSAVGSSMVGGSEPDWNVEGGHDILPEVGNKGIAIVTEDKAWKAEPGRPVHEAFAALKAGSVLHFVTFDPP